MPRNHLKRTKIPLLIASVTIALCAALQVLSAATQAGASSDNSAGGFSDADGSAGGDLATFSGEGAVRSSDESTAYSGSGGGEPSGSGRSELDYVEKLIREGMLDVAENELLRFMESEPSAGLRQRGALLLGDIKFGQGSLAEATSRYLRAYEANPQGEGACQALYKAGECRFLLHQYEEAISTFQRVIKLFPECAQSCPAKTALGKAFFELGDYEQATREFEEALAACGVEQTDPELLYWLGKAQARVNVNRARETFESLRSAHPRTDVAFKASLELSRILFDEGNTQGSLDVLAEALSYKVDGTLRATAFMKRGELLDLTGRPQDAAREYAECFAASEDSSLCEVCNLNSQKAYLSSGDYRQADLLAQRLLSGSFSAKARRLSFFTRARASRALGKYQDALDFISRLGCAREVDSLCCSASVEEGDIRAELSQFEGAARSFLRAMTLPGPDSLHAAALMRLGDLCVRRTGEPDRALGYYNLLVDLYPESETSGSALYEIARLYEKKDEFSRAASLYRKVARDFPLGPYADEALERAESLDALFPIKIGPGELKKPGALIISGASASVRGDTLLEKSALLFAGQFHAFEQALYMLEQAFNYCPPERKPVLLLRLSEVHSLLSRKLQFEGKTNEASTEKDQSLKFLEDIVSQYSDSKVADDARFLLIEDKVEKLPSPEKERTAASLYSELLELYPETNRFADALFGRAHALAKLSSAAGDEPHNEALATYDKLIREFPSDPLVAQARYEKGRMLTKSGDIDGAEREFRVVLTSYSSSAVAPDAAYELAECKLAKREIDEAVTLYASVLEKTKNKSLRERALARKGDCLLVQGKFDEAIQEYEYVLKRDPKGAFADDLLVKEAEAYLSRGMLDKASERFEQLLARFPKSPLLSKSLMRKAEAEALAGDDKKAQATYEEIVTRFPESRVDTNVMLGLARASFGAGDYKSSLDAYDRVLRLDVSESGRVEAARGSVLSLARIGDDEKVRKRLAWYEKNFPADTMLPSEIDFERGMTLFEKNQFQTAYSSLSQSQAKLPAESRIKALVTMGMCKLKEKDFPQASSHFEEALQLGPRDSTLAFTAYFKLGTSLYAQSKYVEASRAYLGAGTVSPDSSSRCEAWYNAGLCIERTENWPEAASLYDKVAAGCRGKLARDAVFKSGYAYLNAGQRPKALELLKAALEAAPDDEKPEIQYWIAEAYAAMGEFERASSEFLKVPYVYGEGSLWAVTARYKAGLAFEEAGNTEAASKQYRLLVEREGENSEWGSMAKERLLKLSK